MTDNALGADTKLKHDPNVLAKRVDDEIVLVHLETNRIYELNSTAASLWDALGEGSTKAELEEQLSREYDVEPAELAREVEDLLEHLSSERLICAK